VKKYTSTYWQADLPDDWFGETDQDSDVLYQSEHDGTLVITALEESQAIDDEYLSDLVEEHIEAGAELYDIELGDFSGVTCCYGDDNAYWCEWYLYADRILLFVTYNCDLQQEGSQDDVVETILESLRLTAALHVH